MAPERAMVVVVGAGPTGVSAAIMLAQRGVDCLILERQPDVYPLPRAVHFDDETFRIFAAMGLEDEVRAISRPLSGMRLTDAGNRVLAEFRRDEVVQAHGFPQANMFDQPELERVLRNHLRRFPGVELRSRAQVVDIAQPANGPAPARVRYRDVDTGSEHEVWAEAILGCDGANSITRRVIGTAIEDFRFDQRWLVVDVDSPEPLHDYDGVQQVCDPERAATFMRVVGERYRWEFRVPEDARPDDIDEARVRDLITPWLNGVDPEKLTIVRYSCYTFRGLVAKRWRKGRVFLLGDAAHQTPPFIGQGMCAGIRDAYNLAWKLALVVHGRAADVILDTYESERRPYARRVVQLAIAIGWLMTGGTARTVRLRQAALRLMTRLPGAEDRALTAVWPAFTIGPLVERAGRRSPGGKLLPQPSVRVDARAVRLDRVLGDGFAVVHRGTDRVSAFDPGTRRFFAALGTKVIRLEDLDDDLELRQLLDRFRVDALLLRPDRVVAAAADTADLRRWRRQLEGAGIRFEEGSPR